MLFSDPKRNMSSHARNYWCFISYKHTDNQQKGRQWATWLHRELETYQIPTSLISPQNDAEGDPERIYSVFRDEEELGAGSHLSDRTVRWFPNISESLFDSDRLSIAISRI